MELGQFSLSLSVKDIEVSKSFYEKMGFKALEGLGSVEEKWLIMKNDAVLIGIFQDMFEHNIMTFNPSDARDIEQNLITKGVAIETKTKGESGPTHFVLKDPDGNTIMFDQHSD
ncbi:VOC family protein [Ningiella sp. W23]|uniref:VOC family protein n=1 Tax=Ningiella sp. W23 TaxID=3023715 RepID=UPI0037564592